MAGEVQIDHVIVAGNDAVGRDDIADEIDVEAAAAARAGFHIDADAVRFDVGAAGDADGVRPAARTVDRDPRAAYAIYDSERKRVDYYRSEYNIGLTAQKIFEAGLPEVLGLRLFRGT